MVFYHVGYQLPVPLGISDRYHWLHTLAPYCLLAHDANYDPHFTYANNRATQCFKYTQEGFIGLPSRCSASETDRPARRALINKVKKIGFVQNYAGPHVDKNNQPFTIFDGMVLHLQHNEHELLGQVALFWPADFISPKWFNKH